MTVPRSDAESRANDAFAAAPDLLDAFIEQPQTNGVAERFFRPLKEQIIHGRIYRMVAELREAVEKFVDLYNEPWLPKKNGFLVGHRSPDSTAIYAKAALEALREVALGDGDDLP